MDIVTELYQRIESKGLWDKTISLKRNEYLILSRGIEKYLYYVVSGSLKLSIVDGEEEYIVRFGYAHDIVTALDSFISGMPTDFTIQAIKKTTVKATSKERYLDFIRQHKENGQLWNDILQQLILQQIEREKDILITSPLKRYQRVLLRSPELFQKIPHRHIASYLRMSPETLSRIKKS